MPRTLLLADESPAIQRVITLAFSQEDVRVVSVGGGEKAVDVIEREHPDIVLADRSAPQQGGIEIARFIRSRPDLRHIPVVLLAGALEPVDAREALAAGCVEVFVKPFDPRLLAERVRELLAGSSTPRDAPGRLLPEDAFLERLENALKALEGAVHARAPRASSSPAPLSPREALPGLDPSQGALVRRVVERVMQQLSPSLVRGAVEAVVTELAERLIREEIKQTTHDTTDYTPRQAGT